MTAADKTSHALIVDGSDDSFHAWPADGIDWTEAVWFGPVSAIHGPRVKRIVRPVDDQRM